MTKYVISLYYTVSESSSSSFNLTAIGSPTGTLFAGSTLTAGTLTPSGAIATYQWESCSTAGGTYNAITGATSSTYVLTASDIGYYFKVIAIGSGSYYSGSVTSTSVGPCIAFPWFQSEHPPAR